MANKKKRWLWIYNVDPKTKIITSIERQKFKVTMTDEEYQKAVSKILKDKTNYCWSPSEPRL